jgi:Cys-rich four helix bundle protein (predicted Tat secretion target)
MNRRELFAAAAGAATFMAAGTALAADEHAGHASHEGTAAPTDVPNAAILATADRCSNAGQTCVNHCLSLFVAGDNSVAGCAKTAYQMTAVCLALARLAAAGSPHLPALAKVAINTCSDCEKECRKHEDHHAVCKACAEACAACIAECKKIAASHSLPPLPFRTIQAGTQAKYIAKSNAFTVPAFGLAQWFCSVHATAPCLYT